MMKVPLLVWDQPKTWILVDPDADMEEKKNDWIMRHSKSNPTPHWKDNIINTQSLKSKKKK